MTDLLRRRTEKFDGGDDKRRGSLNNNIEVRLKFFITCFGIYLFHGSEDIFFVLYMWKFAGK